MRLVGNPSVLVTRSDFSISVCRGTFDGNHGLHEWGGSCRSSQSNHIPLLEVRMALEAMGTVDRRYSKH